MVAKWSGILSTTERNDLGILNVRQGNKESEIAEFQIIQNNKPYNLTEMRVVFCSNYGVSAVKKSALVIDALNGMIAFAFNDECMQQVGRQMAYFEIIKDDIKIDSTQDFEFRVQSSIFSREMEAGSYIESFENILKTLGDNAAYRLGSELDKTNFKLSTKASIELVNENKYVTNIELSKKANEHDLTLKRNIFDKLGVSDVDGELLGIIQSGVGGNTINLEATPPDYSVTKKKTTFFKRVGKNLFNKNDITIGRYVDYTDGSTKELSTYGVSDYIPVKPNLFYIKNTSQQLVFCDIEKNFISGIDMQYVFKTPVNCYYVLMNLELAILNNNIQLELGVSQTSYENYKEVLVDNLIENEDRIVKLEVGKNLFDKSKAQENMFINQENGKSEPVEGFYASDYIELIEGVNFVKNNVNQFAMYDSNYQFKGGAPDGVTDFKTPVGVRYARFTVSNKEGRSVDDFQLERGFYPTTYEPFGYSLGNLSSNSDEGIANYRKVAKLSSPNNTIKKAISSLNSSLKNTIEIFSGDYEEVVEIKTAEKISLVGKNKKDVIIIDKSGDYYKSPLQVAGDAFISGLTVIANNDNVSVLPSPTSYALHADYDVPGTMVFEDDDFKSYQNAAAGIGMHQSQTIIFRRCRFYKDAAYDGGALYFHNAVLSGVTNQKIVFQDCVVIAKQGYALRMDDANIISGDGGGNEMDVTFINCTVYSEELGLNCVYKNTTPIGTGTLVGNIKLNPMSHGNNLAELNA